MRKVVFFTIALALVVSFFTHPAIGSGEEKNSQKCKPVVVSTITLNNSQVIMIKDVSGDDKSDADFAKSLRNEHVRADLAELCDMSEFGMQMITMKEPANSRESILR